MSELCDLIHYLGQHEKLSKLASVYRNTQKSSSFEIAAELSFQDREFVFYELSSWINHVIELTSHFLAVFTADDLIIPGANRDN